MSAVRDAPPGAVIFVKAGRYNEHLELGSKPVTIEGEMVGQRLGTIIEWSHGNAVTVTNQRNPSVFPAVSLRNLVIACRGNKERVHAVSASNGSQVSIFGCHLTSTGLHGSGVSVVGSGTHAHLDECHVTDCGGAGLFLARKASAYVTNKTVICKNDEGGIGVTGVGSTVSINNNSFIRENSRVGLFVSSGGEAILTESVISGNTGFGIIVHGEASRVGLENGCFVRENSKGGIFAAAGANSVVKHGNFISGNEGHGVKAVGVGTHVTARGSVVTSNKMGVMDASGGAVVLIGLFELEFDEIIAQQFLEILG